MLNRSVSLLAIILSVATVARAERPSPDLVSKAVAESRAEYLKQHPVPSKQEKIASINQEIRDIEASIRNLKGPGAGVTVDRTMKKVRELKAEIARIRRNYMPVTPRRLAAFAAADLEIGSVGRINEPDDGRAVYCVQIVDAESMLAYIETTSATSEATSGESDAQRSKSPTFLLKGVMTSGAVAEKPITGAFDVVVTGRHMYEDAEGAMQTVLVVEVFDPDRTFK